MKPALAGTLYARFRLIVYAQPHQVRLDPPVPTGPPTNAAPNPYRTVSGWFKVPAGSRPSGIAVDSKGVIYGAEVVPNDLKRHVKK